VLLAGTNNDIENHPQVTYEISMRSMAGTTRLVRIVAHSCDALLAEQGLDGVSISSIQGESRAAFTLSIFRFLSMRVEQWFFVLRSNTLSKSSHKNKHGRIP
jgi:hypothetical protein